MLISASNTEVMSALMPDEQCHVAPWRKLASLSSSAHFFVGRAVNYGSYKEQGLPGSGVFDSALQLRDVACTVVDESDFWPWNSTCEAQRLRAINVTAAPPSCMCIGTVRPKKAVLVRQRCEKSWGWADQRRPFSNTASCMAQAGGG